MVVSATGYETIQGNNNYGGKLYVYYGSNYGLSDDPQLVYTQFIDSTFYALASFDKITYSGDMDGNGCDDLAYLHYTYPEIGEFQAFLIILFGNETPDTIPDLTYEVIGSSTEITSLGDINGDGFDDIGLTERTSIPASTYKNLHYSIIYGGSFEKVLFKTDLITRNGRGFRGLGDVNADGYDDFSYYYESEPLEQPDGSFLYSHHNRFFFGSTIQDTIPDYSLDLVMQNQWAELAPAGDWDNDGYDDFVISGYELTGSEQGGCRLWRGGETIDWNNYSHIFYFSWFTPAFGDINGDGKGDLVKIYQNYGLGGFFYLFLGDQNGTYDFEWFYNYEGLGFNECIGDFNNDGFDDIAAGARGNEAYPDYGQVFVWNGHADLIEQDPDVGIIEEIISNPQIEFNAYPNPFNPSIHFKIKFNNNEVSKNRKHKIEIYNIKGQVINELRVELSTSKKTASVIWDGRDRNNNQVGNGIYFCKLLTANREIVNIRKVTLLK